MSLLIFKIKILREGEVTIFSLRGWHIPAITCNPSTQTNLG